MNTCARRITGVWLAAALLAAGAVTAAAQGGGGGTLPAYGEPTIIGSPGLQRVFTADFTSDGVPDIAIAAGLGVTVYAGLGNGQFGSGVTTSGLVGTPWWIGDFNGDGTPDLAMQEPETLNNTGISVIFGNGNGTFQPAAHVGALPYETIPAVGDFDGDGRSDVVGAGCWGSVIDGEVYCGIIALWGTPAGSFNHSEFEVALGASRVGHVFFAADFTGDGKPDIVWKQYGQGRFVVVPGLGSRTFAFGSPIANASAGEPGFFAAADFNADGKRDLAVPYSTGLGILYGNGDGSFQAVTPIGTVSGGSDLLAWDINGDGRADLSIRADEGVALLVNNGDGTFRRYALTAGTIEPHSSNSPVAYGTADFNSDGAPDFVLGFSDGKAGVYLGLPSVSAAISASSATSTVSQAVTLTAAVTPSSLTGPVTFYDGARVLGSATLSAGQAVFTTRMLTPGVHAFRAAYGGTLVGAQAAASGPVSHTVGALPVLTLKTTYDVNPGFLAHGLAGWDFDSDGKPDLIASDYASDARFALFKGNGDGTLQDASLAATPYPRYVPRWIVLGDVNQDGKQDVGLHNETATSVHLSNGDGTFSGTSGAPGVAHFADANRDGKLDAIVVGGGTLSVWIGLGSRKGGTLSFSSFDLAVASHNSEIALGDFNGDLIIDVAMTTAQENKLYVLLGNGDGTFQTPRATDRGNGPTCPVVADFNADGKLDLAFINAGTGKLSVLPGKGDGDFLAAIDTTLGGTLTRLIATDLSGDGKVDAAVLSASEDRVIVLPGNGNGTFGAARKYYAGTVPMDVIAADFNGDGRLDMAVSSNADTARGGPARINILTAVNPAPTTVVLEAAPTSAALSQTITMTATVSPSIAKGWVTFNDGATPIGSVPVSAGQAVFQTRLLGSGIHLLAAVFSGDGTIYGASASAPVSVHVAASPAAERAPSAAVSPGAASLAAQADFNSDGVADLIVCNASQTTVLLGQGTGQFTAATPVSVACGASILTADFNRDGKTDLAMGTTIAFGLGDGTFGAPQPIAGSEGFVVAADFNGDGATDLVDLAGRVFLNRGSGTFASPYRLSLGLTLTFYSAVAGDLNADGRADLVVPDHGAGTVHVLLASADGYFLPPVSYASVGSPTKVVMADFNGDGIQDLAVGDGASGGRVGIMLGLGTGTFENWGDTSIGWVYGVSWLSSCDCDGDGNVDLLASAYTGQPTVPNVKLLRGLGDGTFLAAVNYATVPDAQWWLLTDLNQDGRPDIVHNSGQGGTPIYVQMAVAPSSVSVVAMPGPAALGEIVTLTATVSPADAAGTITFYDGAMILGKAAISSGHAVITTRWLCAGAHALIAVYGGDPLHYTDSVSPVFSLGVAARRNRGFAAGTTFTTGRGPKGMATGDLNGDGKLDLVVANSTSNTVSVFLGNGAGGFAPRVTYNTGTTPGAVVVADLNADGTPDVAVANSGSNNVSILNGTGDGTLQAAVNRALGASPRSLAVADLNMDQASDLLVGTSGGGIAAALIGSDGSWPASGWSTIWASTDTVNGITALDLNADGRVDVAAAGESGGVYRLIQQPNGTFSVAPSSTGGNAPAGLAAADFNADGVADLVAPNRTSNNAGVLVGKGDGSFFNAALYATGAGPTAVATGDADGNGALDVIVANGSGNSLTVLPGFGDGTFLAGQTITAGGSPSAVVVGDFDGNGITDLATANSADNTLSLFLGTKDTSRGDFTGDFKTDVLWRHAALGEVWVWPMDGVARTAETWVQTVPDVNWEIRGQGDQDGDGKPDLLWRNKVTGQIYFWPMNGTTPLGEIYVATVDPAYDIVGTGDFDGDGMSDILWRHTTLGDVWIWLMNGASPTSEVYLGRVDPGYAVKGVGDLDGDGKADIVWHHSTIGEVWVWLMNGTMKISETWAGTVPDTGYQIQGVADFTSDGKADILWWHATRGEVWIWTMNGPVRVSETWVSTVPDTSYRVASLGDYNGDTKADILWRNVVNGEVWLWLMNGPVRVSETWVATVPDTGYQVIR